MLWIRSLCGSSSPAFEGVALQTRLSDRAQLSMKVGGRLSVLPCYVAHAQGARGLHLMVRDIIKAGHEECLVILQEYQARDRAL